MTPEEIRARVDAMAERVLPDGRINARHVAMEQTLRERHALPAYIAELDGPGRFRQVTVCGLPDDAPPELLQALVALGRAAEEAFGGPATVVVEDGPCPDDECSAGGSSGHGRAG